MRLSRTVVVLLVVIVAMGAAVAYLALNPDFTQDLRNMTRKTETITDIDTINEMAIAYAAPPFVDDYGLMRVSGYVENLTQDEIRSAKLSIQLFDEDGNKKELVEYTVTDIGASVRKPYDLNVGSIEASRDSAISIVELEVYQ